MLSRGLRKRRSILMLYEKRNLPVFVYFLFNFKHVNRSTTLLGYDLLGMTIGFDFCFTETTLYGQLIYLTHLNLPGLDKIRINTTPHGD